MITNDVANVSKLSLSCRLSEKISRQLAGFGALLLVVYVPALLGHI